ncbi:hypothetical protein [Gemmata sp.]|uniref:hypothetical protein n=1 Tax=Gemmata sp. TaxID=1914242 RepID=UPI003F71BA49
MDEHRRRDALRSCEYHRRGILTAEEACANILFFCVEPALASEYVGLLPDNLRAALVAFLPTLPTTDEGWSDYQGVGQLDGDDSSWAWMIAECRANTEAARAFLLGEISLPAGSYFAARVRVAYRQRLDEFFR